MSSNAVSDKRDEAGASGGGVARAVLPGRRDLLRDLLVLAFPVIIEQTLSTLFQYVDTAMVGHLGPVATTAVSGTTTITWLVGSACYAFGVGAMSLVARALGTDDAGKARDLTSQAFLLALGVGCVLGIVCMAVSPSVPAWMNLDPLARADAGAYFFITSIPMVFRSMSTVLGSAVRATQDTRRPMLVALAANLVNIFLDWLLIYQLGMGVRGAALATAASHVVSGTCMFLVLTRNKVLGWRLRDIRLKGALMREMLGVSLPVLGTGVASCLGYVVFAATVAGMGSVTFAAHSIAVSVEELFYIPGYGLQTSATTLVATALGRRDQEQVRSITQVSIGFSVALMCLSGLALFCTGRVLMGLFTSSPEVVSLGTQVLRLVALSEPLYGLLVMSEGILYGLGRTRYPFVVETASMWGVRILFTTLCVKVWGLGLMAVWLCMVADNVTKALCMGLPALRVGIAGAKEG